MNTIKAHLSGAFIAAVMITAALVTFNLLVTIQERDGGKAEHRVFQYVTGESKSLTLGDWAHCEHSVLAVRAWNKAMRRD